MLDIRRVSGGAPGRSAGSSYNGFAWAVATSPDDVPDIHEQTVNALAMIDEILAGMDTDKTRLINATVYLARMHDKAEMDRAWVAWMGDDPAPLAPARLRGIRPCRLQPCRNRRDRCLSPERIVIAQVRRS